MEDTLTHRADPTVVACALDGVGDYVLTQESAAPDGVEAIKCVILPRRATDEILVGDEVESSRVQLGLPWPPESRVDPESDLHRIPIPFVWRGLLNSKNGRGRWSAAGTPGYAFTDLLSRHVRATLPKELTQKTVILTVPDTLSDFAQQRLLESVRRSRGLKNVRLLWRPIALALEWIRGLGEQVHSIEDDDGILVISMAPDSVDSVFVRFRRQEHEGLPYLLPIRTRSAGRVKPGGIELTLRRVEQVMSTASGRADAEPMWQAFNGIPSIWEQAHVEDQWWYVDDKWRAFPVEKYWNSDSLSLEPSLPSSIKRILKKNETAVTKNAGVTSWNKLLASMVNETLPEDPTTPVRGVILAGLPQTWTDLVMKRVSSRLSSFTAHLAPRVDACWTPQSASIACARGAADFGNRLNRGHPTYLDALPELEIYAFTPERGGEWDPLIRQEEIEGGAVYKDRRKDEFALHKDQTVLEAYLRMRSEGRWSIKKTVFRFPQGPSTRMSLDVVVEARPAGGLATVEILPRDGSFLRGVQIFLDYEEMEDVDKVPDHDLSWPPLVPPLEVDPEDEHLFDPFRESVIRRFLDSEYGSSNYSQRLESLQAQLNHYISDPISRQRYMIVSLAGEAMTCRGQALITALTKRMGEDYARSWRNKKVRHRLVTTGAWLFGAVPQEIRAHIVKNLETKPQLREVHAAARVFRSRKEYDLFFAAMINAARNPKPRQERRILQYWLLGARRLLTTHEDAVLVLKRKQVEELYEHLLSDLPVVIRQRKPQVFGAIIQMLIYLLRFRKNDQSFLAPDNKTDSRLRSRLDNTVNECVSITERAHNFLGSGRTMSAKEALEILIYFLNEKGNVTLLEKLDREYGEDSPA